MKQWRTFAVAAAVLLAALSRLLPHEPNFTPLGAMALLGGATLRDRRLAFAVPLATMFLSDMFIGFHATTPFVYAAFILIVGIGILIRRRTPGQIALGTLAASLTFFVVSNLGPWFVFYEKTFAGLVLCYIQAIPFFDNTLRGDVVYVAVLFGGFAFLERHVPGLSMESTESVPQPERV